MKKLYLLLCLFIPLLLFNAVSCNNSSQQQTGEGEQLAKQCCGSCHMVPAASALDKTTWLQYVLPKMGKLLGLRSLGSGGRYYAEANAAITLDKWNKLVLYYYTNAPVTLPTPKENYPIAESTSLFRVQVAQTTIASPATTMVSLAGKEGKLLFGDGQTGMVYTMKNNTIVDSFFAGVGVSSVANKGDHYQALCMGLLHPSDERKGRLVATTADPKNPLVLLDSLQRPVHASYFDADGDGKEDVIVCAFGNNTGSLSWYRNIGPGQFQQNMLRNLPGAIQSAVYDFNSDGKPDILALMAQGDEGFFIYYNMGGGKFKEERILQFPPSFGSNSFQLIDFNNDGFMDIMATNGDNGDYPPILKPYHGIRVYLNNKANGFSENLFLPVNGIGKAIALDYDGDGDLDIASIAYFPDFELKPREGFIYWENTGANHYKASSVKEVGLGRWLTMDAGDMDGDEDIDIVLGNANFLLGRVPAILKTKWDAYSPSVIILRNQMK